MVLMTHERCALKKKKHCRLEWTDETCAWQQELARMHCIWASFSGRFFTAITARLRPMTILGPEWFIPGITRRDSMPIASVRKTFGHHQSIFNYFSRIIITIHWDIQIPYRVAPLVVSCFTTAMNYWYYLPYFIDFTQLFASSWQGGRLTLIYVSTPNLGFESLFVYSFQVAQHQRYSGHSRFYGSRTRVISNAI